MQYIPGVGLDAVIAQLKGVTSDNSVEKSQGSAVTTLDHRGDEPLSPTDAVQCLLAGVYATDTGVEMDRSQLKLTSTSTERGDDTQISADTAVTPVLVSPRPVSPAYGERNYWPGLARIGLQVAEALAHAHAQGTLHRDIKPGNLLLDRQGTVWVTDFGLAKAMAHEALSQSGEVVGTLRYMAPEQLAGSCDARSDIYALGLTLYELLTLQPAFTDTDHNQLIQKVSSATPVPPRKLRPAIPRDLETIVLKAISRDPLHRYQNAESLAEDLRRYLDDRPILARRVGPIERTWRWSRRNPAIAALSLLLLGVVLGSFATISWKWRDAEQENRRAEANLSLALDSMDQVVERFASTWMSHPAEPQGEDVDADFRMVVSASTAAVLEDALQFYGQFAEQNATTPRLQHDTASAHRRIGEIHHRLGQYDKAGRAFRQAIEIFDKQLVQSPGDPHLSTEKAATLNQLGEVYIALGEHSFAKQYFERARRQLSDSAHDGSDSRFELARTFHNLGGAAWMQRRPSSSAQHHHHALDLLKQLVHENPAKAQYRLALARSYRRCSQFADSGKRETDAAKYRSQAISILEDLVRDFPRVPDYQCELSETLEMASGNLEKSEHQHDAEIQLCRAVDLARGVADQYPTIPRYRASLARALRSRGSLLSDANCAEEAVRDYREAVGLDKSLCEDFPTIPVYSFFLSRSSHEFGDVLRDAGDLSESRVYLTEAVEFQRKYLAFRPESKFGRGMLAVRLESLAKTLEKLGEHDEAAKCTSQADEIRNVLQRRMKKWRRPEKPPMRPPIDKHTHSRS
jgi:tetratricopeptide (TPR) repeat protein